MVGLKFRSRNSADYFTLNKYFFHPPIYLCYPQNFINNGPKKTKCDERNGINIIWDQKSGPEIYRKLKFNFNFVCVSYPCNIIETGLEFKQNCILRIGTKLMKEFC